jgi:hypothetical protein
MGNMEGGNKKFMRRHSRADRIGYDARGVIQNHTITRGFEAVHKLAHPAFARDGRRAVFENALAMVAVFQATLGLENHGWRR